MQVKIEKLDNFGRGITWINDKICFIPDTLPGEVVDISVVATKKKYLLGEVLSYIKKSDSREIPKCRYYDVCGGCSMMHMSYEVENKFKHQKVCELLEKFTDKSSELVKPCEALERVYYRNKIVLHSSNNKLGLYKEDTNELVPIDKCILVNDKINKIIEFLNKTDLAGNISKAMIRVGNVTNEVILEIDGDIDDYYQLLELVNVLIINGKVISENNKITSVIGNKKYLVSARSFFQVNSYLTKKLYDEVYSIVKDKKSKRVLDLYCGTGTIGIYISDLVDEVVGIEVVEDAIIDANSNKRINNSKNVSFMRGKVEDIINNIDRSYDTIIVDPPRSGLDGKVVSNILKISPKTLIYVSCDPVTLMRDINLLAGKYDLEYIKPFNMFPNTYHVECVAALYRRESKKMILN